MPTAVLTGRSGTQEDTKRFLDLIRADLEQQRRFRVEQLETSAAKGEPEPLPPPDKARLEISDAIRAGAVQALLDIEAALGRLADGSFGTCAHCGNILPREQLEVAPAVQLCVRCGHAKSRQR